MFSRDNLFNFPFQSSLRPSSLCNFFNGGAIKLGISMGYPTFQWPRVTSSAPCPRLTCLTRMTPRKPRRSGINEHVLMLLGTAVCVNPTTAFTGCSSNRYFNICTAKVTIPPRIYKCSGEIVDGHECHQTQGRHSTETNP